MASRRAALAAALVVISATPMFLAGTAAATEVSAAELQQLARDATAGDEAARARLDEVDRVDGVPVDVRAALGSAEERAPRVRALASPAAGAQAGPVPAAIARQEAAGILDAKKYRPARTPKPFRGVVRTLGRWLRPIAEPVGRFLERLLENAATRMLLVAAAVGITVIVTRHLASRRARGIHELSRRRATSSVRADPVELERAADDAERRGELSLAFRLRFQAGVLRLAAAGRVPARASVTTGDLQRHVASDTFSGLARRFDEIAYGGAPAAADDLATARAQWPRVLAEAHRS